MKYILILSIFIFFNNFVFCAKYRLGKFNMKIGVYLESKENIIDTIDNIPVYPLGTDILLSCIVLNNSNKSIAIEDPKTSQKYFIQCKSEDHIETSFLLNPSMVDKTGEITCNFVKKIILKKDEARYMDVPLKSQITDQLFISGKIEISIAYDTIYSNPLILYLK